MHRQDGVFSTSIAGQLRGLAGGCEPGLTGSLARPGQARNLLTQGISLHEILSTDCLTRQQLKLSPASDLPFACDS